ncbi:MAG: hypothetical protein P8183_21165, partial [Anaerolineae bacterium]
MSPKLISIVVLLLLVAGLTVIAPAAAAPETAVLSSVEVAVTPNAIQQTGTRTTIQAAPQPQQDGGSSSLP